MIDGVLVQGLYLDNPANVGVVTEFVENLGKSPLFNLNMKEPRSIYLENPGEDPKAWATNYKLQLTFKQGIAIP